MSEYGKLPETLAKRRSDYRRKIIDAIYTSAKSRASKRGLDFNIDKSDIIIPQECPILNIPLFVSEGKASDNSPTLDRVDPKQGYVKGNVRVISHRANSKKQDNTIEDMELFIRYMKGQI